MKKLIEFLKEKIQNFLGSIAGFVLKRADAAEKVTTIIKEVLDFEGLSLVVALTPNKTDDRYLAKAKELAPKVIAQVGLALGLAKALDAEKDPIKQASIVIDYVKTKLPKEGNGVFLREFAGKLGEATADGKVTGLEFYGLVNMLHKGILK